MAESIGTTTTTAGPEGDPADPADPGWRGVPGEGDAAGAAAAAARPPSAGPPGNLEPQCAPLDGLDEVLAWTEAGKGPDWAAFQRPMAPGARRFTPGDVEGRGTPRTLVCHDMMGGYLDDRFVQGVCSDEPYSFYHWAHVDVFIYFSHHTVTVPPVGWVNAAHRHAVPILGTFITEWRGGEEVCDRFLQGEESARALANQLVRISTFYQLDGWFINIENNVQPEKVAVLLGFLRYLRELLRAASPRAMVLWYDSVVASGRLDWQNELNDKNRPFFDASDGIFLNYAWTSEGLVRSAELAGSRRADVYAGVDVFGRGLPGREGYAARISMQEIWNLRLSAAIFAPGWVYERHERPDFHNHQHRFWSAMVEHTNPHSVSALPISTSFCRGQGRNLYRRGKVCRAGPWHNLSSQNLQPIYTDTRQLNPEGAEATAVGAAVASTLESHVYLRSVTDVAFEGGGCLLVQGLLAPDKARLAVRLLSVMVHSPPTLLLSYVYRVGGGSGGGAREGGGSSEEAGGGAAGEPVRLGLELTTMDSTKCTFSNVSVLHAPVTTHRPTALPIGDAVSSRLRQQCGGLPLQSWTHRCYLLELRDCMLQDVFVTVEKAPGVSGPVSFQCHLGLLQMFDASALARGWEAFGDVGLWDVTWTSGTTPASLLLSATLRWSYPSRHLACFRVSWRTLPTAHGGTAAATTLDEGTAEPALLGEAFTNVYRLHELLVPSHVGPGEALLEFLVQPVSLEGFVAPWNESGHVQISYCAPAREVGC
ncbi:cytosolic endo-beta-N-acetylglucosaminidase [Petromyzon marinus]|uniref:cytosolic endo-beta-N-acetylglucosaminidase n=1 Tax=Petromyzon marinus TaxID=7757 RepID=UPI003F6FF3D2